MPTDYPTRQPTGQFSRLAPRLVDRALRSGTRLPVIVGSARPQHPGLIIRALPFKSASGLPLGYEIRLERDGARLSSTWVTDLPGQLLPWYPNSAGSLGAWVTMPDLDGLARAALSASRQAEQAA